MTKKLLGIILILVLTATLCGIVSADVIPAPLTLKLTVQISPLDVYPPYMIYTAQLSYMPPIISTKLKADFYNFVLNSPTNTNGYIGSAYFDNTGKAVFSQQVKQGAYVALAETIINGYKIQSNKVEYKVP